MAQFCGYALIEGFCSGPAKLGMTVGQSVCCGSRPWDTRRVARLDGRKVFAARVGSVADGRGVVSLDNVLIRSHRPSALVQRRACKCNRSST